MTLQEAKDQAATEWNFRDYEEMTDATIPDDKFINRAMEIYSSQQRTKGIKEGFEAALQVSEECKVWNCEGNIRKYLTVDDYLTRK